MDIDLAFERRGCSEPLLLLHGNGEDNSYFKNQMGPLSRHFEVFAVDTRGHGQSPRGSAIFSLAQFAEDLRRFMERQGLKKAHVLGFSDGGNTALLFALRYPHMVGKLILNCSYLRLLSGKYIWEDLFDGKHHGKDRKGDRSYSSRFGAA